MNGTLSVDLRNADVLDVTADALAIQYPQRLHGVIERVQKAFAQAHRPVLLPAPDATRLLEGVPGIAAPRVLIVGVAPLHRYDYRDIHSFAKRAVLLLASVSGVHHIAMPVYGPGYGLDEGKSFESQLAGLFDAVRGTMVSDVIRTITLTERDALRAQRLNELFSLEQFRKARAAAIEANESGADTAKISSEASSPVEQTALRRVFLCYRREDTQDAAGRLYDRLSDVYGPDRVFMDIDSIPLGIDFVEHVELQISRCRAVIVMIGRQWLSITDQRHRRRLDNEDDLVRAEIRAALLQGIPVIPVTVQNAPMPGADDLPDDIRALARRNGIQLRPEHWRDGVERLIRELDGVIETGNSL